ncbi:hypothetical protein [Methylomagnum ishizawai]|uniref:hypothetical protein n=1 Tax=Methylomagnum ishizawai TaxID=1760988 RepID=UPI001C33B359|nr:hypothetical protein [Methylomagnum ishizawai]BBL75052.1 hypothetical protein MishRS11D_21500 [Methylomagnum ishizawai]
MKPTTPYDDANPFAPLLAWIDRNFLALGRELRLAYLPPLMIYLAAGISGLTGIVGTFFVKEYLGLSAEFLAGLGFWTMLPWSLKLPLGHLVDLIWRYKAGLVFLGAGLVAASLLIMIGLLADRAALEAIAPAGTWYVASTLLAPIGYVVQDVVADAMTVEAVPRVGPDGRLLPEEEQRLMHSTMQTLGRVAIIGGTLLVALVNVAMFQGAEHLPQAEKLAIYQRIYAMALVIPAVSVGGVLLAAYLKRRTVLSLSELGYTRHEIETLTSTQPKPPQANWWILGGGLLFGLMSLSVGLSDVVLGQEIIFLLSLAIVLALMGQLMREMRADARTALLGTAVLIFVFRAMPSPGPGSSWWMIDVLGFDQSFMAKLSLIGSALSLFGLFIFRRFMAERSMPYIILVLTLAGTVLSLPTIGMYYGLHEWTAALTGGVVDARFIALVDTALESPLGQVAMVPMLAWIAHSAPAHLKATFFAVLASFTNLSLALAQLGTKYLNQLYTITREVKDPVSGIINVPADYSQLGRLLIVVTVLGLALPLASILLVRALRWRTV